MTIFFLVAGSVATPSGGTRIILEHAKRLAEQGQEVVLVQVYRLPYTPWPRQIKNFLVWAKEVVSITRGCPWFNLGDKIRQKRRFFRRLPPINADDKLVATYYPTHELMNTFLETHSCYNFIQGYETFFVDAQVLHDHWRSPSHNVTVSRWLQKLVYKESGQADLVPNAIDQTFFHDLGIRSSTGVPLVLFISLPNEAKGTRDLVEAINSLEKEGLQFSVAAFGKVNPREFGLAVDCEYYPSPSQETIRELYSRAHIFVSASHSEGWGLPLAEATACGAALVVSDTRGHFEFLRPNREALFFPRKDVEQMVRQLRLLLEDECLRKTLVKGAQASLRSFTWENSTNELLKVLGISGGRKGS